MATKVNYWTSNDGALHKSKVEAERHETAVQLTDELINEQAFGKIDRDDTIDALNELQERGWKFTPPPMTDAS